MIPTASKATLANSKQEVEETMWFSWGGELRKDAGSNPAGTSGSHDAGTGSDHFITRRLWSCRKHFLLIVEKKTLMSKKKLELKKKRKENFLMV